MADSDGSVRGNVLAFKQNIGRTSVAQLLIGAEGANAWLTIDPSSGGMEADGRPLANIAELAAYLASRPFVWVVLSKQDETTKFHSMVFTTTDGPRL